jgi:hypothetical protein
LLACLLAYLVTCLPCCLLTCPQVTSEQFLEVPWSVIQQMRGGSYVITISRASSRLVWELKVGVLTDRVRQ